MRISEHGGFGSGPIAGMMPRPRRVGKVGATGFFLSCAGTSSLSWVRDEEQRCDVRARQRDVAQIVSIYELLTIGGSRFPELSVKAGVYYGSVG